MGSGTVVIEGKSRRPIIHHYRTDNRKEPDAVHIYRVGIGPRYAVCNDDLATIMRWCGREAFTAIYEDDFRIGMMALENIWHVDDRGRTRPGFIPRWLDQADIRYKIHELEPRRGGWPTGPTPGCAAAYNRGRKRPYPEISGSESSRSSKWENSTNPDS
jgi:hypothetical protein